MKTALTPGLSRPSLVRCRIFNTKLHHTSLRKAPPCFTRRSQMWPILFHRGVKEGQPISRGCVQRRPEAPRSSGRCTHLTGCSRRCAGRPPPCPGPPPAPPAGDRKQMNPAAPMSAPGRPLLAGAGSLPWVRVVGGRCLGLERGVWGGRGPRQRPASASTACRSQASGSPWALPAITPPASFPWVEAQRQFAGVAGLGGGWLQACSVPSVPYLPPPLHVASCSSWDHSPLEPGPLPCSCGSRHPLTCPCEVEGCGVDVEGPGRDRPEWGSPQEVLGCCPARGQLQGPSKADVGPHWAGTDMALADGACKPGRRPHSLCSAWAAQMGELGQQFWYLDPREASHMPQATVRL